MKKLLICCLVIGVLFLGTGIALAAQSNQTPGSVPILSWVVFGIWMVSSFCVWRLYHKIFHVVYINLVQALFREIFFSALIGMFIAGVIAKMLGLL